MLSRDRLLHPLGLTLFGVSAFVALAVAVLPPLVQRSDRAGWLLLLGLAAYVATVIIARPREGTVDYGAGEGDAEGSAPVLAPPRLRGQGHPAGLTAREVEVLRLIALGMTDKEIAEALVIEPRTAATHAQHIRDKIGARNRADAARWYIEHFGLPRSNATGDRGS